MHLLWRILYYCLLCFTCSASFCKAGSDAVMEIARGLNITFAVKKMSIIQEVLNHNHIRYGMNAATNILFKT
jgi:hypothetical protein